MSDDHYDVIIIGTGAGGGTLAHRLAPAGKRVLLLERGDYLPRERDNWDSTRGLRRGASTARRSSGTTGTATSSRPRSTTTSAATPSSTARRCSGCGPRTSASSATTAGSRRPGRSTTPTSSRTTPRPSTSTGSTAGTARTRPRARRAPTYAVPAGRARAADPAAVRRPGEAGPAPVPPADRRQPRPRTREGRATHASVCIRCDRVDGFPCLVDGKSDAQVICVDPALAHRNVELLTNAHVRAAGDRRRPVARSPASSPAGRGRRDRSPSARTSWSSPAAR